jgi:hypothetical protein
VGDPASVICRGAFELSVPAERAIGLFTPEDERLWAEGWDPRYPDPDAEPTAAGTAFTTTGEHGALFWLITGSEALSKSYARFDPRGIVALIEVACTPAPEGSTRVEVTYRLTAVHDAARAEIADFEGGYDAYLTAWKRAIEPVL